MINRFRSYIEEQHLFPIGEEVLLAISGGVDSTVLCDLMYEAGFRFSMAHCNFHLRPGDCDRDEAFVRQLAERYGVKLYVAEFDTLKESQQSRQSIEETARRLRYQFFAKVCREQGMTTVATAHHRDDATETFFLNLLRGTGIAGLHGIMPASPLPNHKDDEGHLRLVRPLLPFGRDEIESYAVNHGLQHVEDVTNQSLEYRRNQIRHQLLPLLRELAPGFDATMQANIQRLQETEQLFAQKIADYKRRLVHQSDDGDYLILSEIDDLRPQETIFFELLRDYGFKSAQASAILAGLHGASGAQFFSTTHRLVRDRERLLLAPLTRQVQTCKVTFEVKERNAVDLRADKSEAFFDADKVHFPLHERQWRNGDRFRPFGMKGTKLLSDFFCDEKMTLLEKEQQLLLCDADDNILWVVGRRASAVAVVTSETERVLVAKKI